MKEKIPNLNKDEYEKIKMELFIKICPLSLSFFKVKKEEDLNLIWSCPFYTAYFVIENNKLNFKYVTINYNDEYSSLEKLREFFDYLNSYDLFKFIKIVENGEMLVIKKEDGSLLMEVNEHFHPNTIEKLEDGKCEIIFREKIIVFLENFK